MRNNTNPFASSRTSCPELHQQHEQPVSPKKETKLSKQRKIYEARKILAEQYNQRYKKPKVKKHIVEKSGHTPPKDKKYDYNEILAKKQKLIPTGEVVKLEFSEDNFNSWLVITVSAYEAPKFLLNPQYRRPIEYANNI